MSSNTTNANNSNNNGNTNIKVTIEEFIKNNNLIENILKSLKNPLLAIFPLVVIRYIDFGDRSLDQAVTGLVVTLLTILVSFIIDYLIIKSNTKVINLSEKEYGYINWDSVKRKQIKSVNIDDISWHYIRLNISDYKLIEKILKHFHYLWMSDKLTSNIPVAHMFNPNDINNDNKENKLAFEYYYFNYGSEFAYWFKIENKLVLFFLNKNQLIHIINLWKDEMKLTNEEVDIITNNRLNYNYNEVLLKPIVDNSYNLIVNNNSQTIEYYNNKITYNSLFFEQKEVILNLLSRFKDSNMYPDHISYENKLGFLLHGEPGTGKTAFVLALGN
jgi:hypothetical protein